MKPKQVNLLNSEESVLLVIDIQPRLTAVMSDASAMLTHTSRLLLAAKLLQVKVLVTEQSPEKLGATVSEISEHLPENAQLFAKLGFSCCSIVDFNRTLAESDRKQIILCGQETHICVLQTALELNQLGYQVFVVEDAVCSRRESHKYYALQRLQQQGVTIVNYESVLFEWLRTANHSHFKAISVLLR